jgi:hypothetical protein
MSIVYLNDTRGNTEQFAAMLESLSKALLGEPCSEPGELQQLACHASAGPLLIVLIRVLTYASDSARKEWFDASGKIDDNKEDFRLGIAKLEPRYSFGSPADKAVRQILCWQKGETVQEYAGDIIYGLSGEARGSHLLETMFRLCYDEFYAELLRCGDFLSPTSLQEYCAHDVSNFVVQTVLTTIRDKEQAEAILKVMEKVISNGLAIDPAKKRRGIVWRSVELAAKFRVEQDGVLKAIRLGFLALKESSSNEIDNKDESTTPGKKRKKERKKASSVELKDCVLLFLQMQQNSDDVERITLDAAGARTVYHLLRFSPRLCEEVLDGIVHELSAESLISLAKDGLGSRCILDGILDGPVQTPLFQKAVRELRTKLSGRFVTLACHRVGHHVVRKLFSALPTIEEKEKFMEDLVKGKNALRGNVMGRSVIEHTQVEMYEVDKKAWRRKVA